MTLFGSHFAGTILGTSEFQETSVYEIEVSYSNWKTREGIIKCHVSSLDVLIGIVSLNVSPLQTKRKYRIASANAVISEKKPSPSMLRSEGRQKGSSTPTSSRMVDKDEIVVSSKGQIDLELQKMRSMTPQEAAAVAAQAVAEAEAAIAEAEEAVREAEAAEADAEAAQAFAEAAMKTLKGRNSQRLVIHSL